MILAHLSKAFREQNWFAVALEFVIVILGVVIGFQIQAWNVARGDRVREAAYLERLHDEIESLVATRDYIITLRERTYGRLLTYADIVNGRVGEAPDQNHCNAFGRSFIVSNPTDSLAVLDELLSVGGMDTIRSGPVRAAVSNYVLVARRARDSIAFSANVSLVLQNHFPHLIQAVAVANENGRLGMRFDCDFEGIRTDPAFQSALATNGSNLNSNMLQNDQVDEALLALHEAVDDALGLSAADHDRPLEATE